MYASTMLKNDVKNELTIVCYLLIWIVVVLKRWTLRIAYTKRNRDSILSAPGILQIRICEGIVSRLHQKFRAPG